MPQEPGNFFGWLLNCCVSDEGKATSGDALSTALVFASGIATGLLTLYFAGFYHVL